MSGPFAGGATETSTEDALGAGEAIETISRAIAAAHPADLEVIARTDAIADTIGKIFEACHFQDITGQRITKVVPTLRFIEERILATTNIWGMDTFADLPNPPQDSDRDAAFPNRPQPPNQGISRENIDAPFV